MLIKKADVKNHLAAKRRKRHLLPGSIIGETSAKRSSVSAEDTGPQKSSNKFVVPIRSSGGD
jgi:hypothetical protein